MEKLITTEEILKREKKDIKQRFDEDLDLVINHINQFYTLNNLSNKITVIFMNNRFDKILSNNLLISKLKDILKDSGYTDVNFKKYDGYLELFADIEG